MFWLGYRNHHLGFPVRRAAYHAFEAKIMAESSPFVNESMDILVADSSRWCILSNTLPAAGNMDKLPITIDELKTDV